MTVPPKRTVDISPLKNYVYNFPKNSMLRMLVVSEADELEADEYMIKMGVWLRSLRLELEVAESG